MTNTIAKTYIVGGAVRDALMTSIFTPSGYTFIPKDIDYVIVGQTSAMMNALYGDPIGADFPVWLDKDGNEVALARVERSTGDKTTDFDFTTDGVTIEDDLSRRDLTINAIAVPFEGSATIALFSLDGKDVIDPFNGIEDIKNRILRHTTYSFVEDPLRVLRLARFYARYYDQGFTVAPETRVLCERMVASGMLNELPRERIWLETLKVLDEKNAHAYFQFLSEVGFCAIPSARELMSLKHANLTRVYDSAEHRRLARWAAFDGRNRFTRTFGATKAFDKVSQLFMCLNVANVFDATIVDTIKELGGYQNGVEFIIALSQLDRIRRITIEVIIERTRNIKVDCEQGPEYGRALAEARRKECDLVLHGY